MKKDRYIYGKVSLAIIVCTAFFYMAGKFLNKPKFNSHLILKIGEEFVIGGDTVKIIDYSEKSDSFILSDGREIKSKIIL